MLPDEDPLASHESRDWEQYWRILYRKISKTDIEDFEKKYKGSEEELADLKKAYLDGEGDMQYILDNVILADVEDEPRFRELLAAAVEQGGLPHFDTFFGEPDAKAAKRKQRARAEAAEASKLAKKLNIDTPGGLQAMILSRQKAFDATIASLEAKYGGGAASGEKKKKAAPKKLKMRS